MRSRLRRATGLGLALGLALGCSSGAEPASASSGSKSQRSDGTDSTQTPAAFELSGNGNLQVDFGQRTPLSVRLTADGEPIEGETVSFALLGRSLDSGLEQLDAVSNAAGMVENALLAGKMPARFRVRVSARNASDAFYDVSVSNAGVGTLNVTLGYDGRRAIAARSLYAQSNVGCGARMRQPDDPSVTLNTKMDVAQFLALPVSGSYTVTALAQSSGGTLVAQGCSEGGAVAADTDTFLDVQLVDVELALSGQFDLQALLDSSAPSAALVRALRAAAQAVVQTDSNKQPVIDAEGVFMLDSLDGVLRSDGYANQTGTLALANELSDARMNPSGDTPEHSLANALAVAKQGPLATLAKIVDYTQRSLDNVRLFAKLGLSSDTHPLSWQNQRIEALPLGEGASPPSVDLSNAQSATEVDAQFAASEDTLELASVRMHAQLGLLAAQTLTKVTGLDLGGHGDEIRGIAGCSTLRDWLSAQPFKDRRACDAACIESACDRAVARLVGAGQSALVALDGPRPWLTLSGTILLIDGDGDLRAERLDASAITGAWEVEAGAGSGDAVSGAAAAGLSMTTTPQANTQ